MKFHFSLKFHTSLHPSGYTAFHRRSPQPPVCDMSIGLCVLHPIHLLQQHPAFVGGRGTPVVVIQAEFVVLPTIKPLDAVVELGVEVRRRLRELVLASSARGGAAPAAARNVEISRGASRLG